MQEYNISLSLDKEAYKLLNDFTNTYNIKKSLLIRLLIKYAENNRYFLDRLEFYQNKYKNINLTDRMIEEITK